MFTKTTNYIDKLIEENRHKNKQETEEKLRRLERHYLEKNKKLAEDKEKVILKQFAKQQELQVEIKGLKTEIKIAEKKHLKDISKAKKETRDATAKIVLMMCPYAGAAPKTKRNTNASKAKRVITQAATRLMILESFKSFSFLITFTLPRSATIANARRTIAPKSMKSGAI